MKQKLFQNELAKNPSNHNSNKGDNCRTKSPSCPFRRFFRRLSLFCSYWRNASESRPIFTCIWFNNFVTNIYECFIKTVKFAHMAKNALVINQSTIPLFIIKCKFSIAIRNNSSRKVAKVSTVNAGMFRQFHSHILTLNHQLARGGVEWQR